MSEPNDPVVPAEPDDVAEAAKAAASAETTKARQPKAPRRAASAKAGASKAKEPEVSEPEVAEPEVSEPEVTEPEVTEPKVATRVREAAKPVAAEPPAAPAEPAVPAGPDDAALVAPMPDEPKPPSRWRGVGRRIVQGSVLTSLLAFIIALLVGAILIAASDLKVQAAAGYFFSRPGDMLAAIWDSVSSAYSALFRGAIFDPGASGGALTPLGDTLKQAAPLIIGGLGLGIGFRAGLFNIGGRGQIVIGGILCGYIGFGIPMPYGLHVVAAILGALVGGALWGFIPGILRARTGANEVIVTIMLNSIALALNDLLLKNPAFQARAGMDISPRVDRTAQLPFLFDSSFAVDWGFIVAIACAVGVWWLMDRSVFGFRMRAVGENPDAARTAGIKVENVYLMALVIGGALLGLVSATQILAAESPLPLGTGGSVAGTLGFDAITVALLGRSKPLGTVLAGLLFGALSAGGRIMQTAAGTPIDVILVLESVVVLFIAAPPLVRAIFRLPDPERKPSKRKLARLAATEGVAA